jgi:anti-sigma factor RsiW
VVEIVTDYLEGAMPRSQRRRLEAHLALCDGCSEYLRQMRITIEVAGRLSNDDVTPEMHAELAAVFARWRSEPS